MTPETLITTLSTATLIFSSLGVLAIRHRSWRFFMAAIALLLVIAVAFVAPSYADAGDLFILWRLMIMVVIGAASLVVFVVCMIFGAMVGGLVVIGDILLAKKGERLPLWFTVPICLALTVSIGLALNLDP